MVNQTLNAHERNCAFMIVDPGATSGWAYFLGGKYKESGVLKADKDHDANARVISHMISIRFLMRKFGVSLVIVEGASDFLHGSREGKKRGASIGMAMSLKILEQLGIVCEIE